MAKNGERMIVTGKSLSRRRSRIAVLGLFLASGLGAALLILAACRSGAPPVTSRVKIAPGAKPDPADIQSHVDTGFPLEGRHAELSCEACHGEKEPKPDCRTCHTPPHGAKFKKDCISCHTPGHPFAEVKFRHPDKGLFSLHQDVGCVRCHAEKKFQKAVPNCASCHSDYHKGSVGRDCYACHRQPGWTATNFNHNGTGFPLMGTHRALECGDCHRDLQSFRITPRPASCAVCHETDYRGARFPHAAYGAGRDCQECHLQDSWSYAHSPFWFNIQTGRHAGIDCSTCHADPTNYRQYSCRECHKGHSGDRNGRCLDCHPAGFPHGQPPAAIPASGRRP